MFYSFSTRLTGFIDHKNTLVIASGGFASVLTNVLQLDKGKSPIAEQYNETRQDALAEDLPGSDGHLAN